MQKVWLECVRDEQIFLVGVRVMFSAFSTREVGSLRIMDPSNHMFAVCLRGSRELFFTSSQIWSVYAT